MTRKNVWMLGVLAFAASIILYATNAPAIFWAAVVVILVYAFAIIINALRSEKRARKKKKRQEKATIPETPPPARARTSYCKRCRYWVASYEENCPGCGKKLKH